MTIKGVFFDFYGTLCVLDNMTVELDEWILELYTRLKRYGLVATKDDICMLIPLKTATCALPKEPRVRSKSATQKLGSIGGTWVGWRRVRFSLAQFILSFNCLLPIILFYRVSDTHGVSSHFYFVSVMQ